MIITEEDVNQCSIALRRYYMESWHQALRILLQMSPAYRKKHFRMRDWGIRTSCGTVACLGGHCALDPWFQYNREISYRWFHCYSGDKLHVRHTDFDGVFGRGQWSNIFYATDIDHAEAVRRVRQKIAEFGGERIILLGWGGIPARTRVLNLPCVR